MRTTVTLDPDVEAKLRALARERGLTFKEALNASLRLGLAGSDERARPYRVPTHPMGLRPGIDLDRALALAGELEDAELARKLELRK
jgi:hypothetical protein